MPWKWYDSKVIKIQDASPNTKRIWVEVPDETLDFKAGQFVTMDLPIHQKRLQRWRSYSIANHPDGSNVLEFCVVKLEGGAGSTYLFEQVEEGSTLRFKGPSGAFYLPNTIEKDLVFVCTGTGVAPFRSMLWDIYTHEIPHQKIHLIFGTRYADGVLYQEEFQKFAAQHPEFSYSVALSRAEQLPDVSHIQFSKGYVHPVYMEQYTTPRDDVDFYLCGWSNMIDEAVEKLLLQRGFDKSQIHYELYG